MQLLFRTLKHSDLEIVSDFDIRISNLINTF
jgi:hypothetical protein